MGGGGGGGGRRERVVELGLKLRTALQTRNEGKH